MNRGGYPIYINQHFDHEDGYIFKGNIYCSEGYSYSGGIYVPITQRGPMLMNYNNINQIQSQNPQNKFFQKKNQMSHKNLQIEPFKPYMNNNFNQFQNGSITHRNMKYFQFPNNNCKPKKGNRNNSRSGSEISSSGIRSNESTQYGKHQRCSTNFN